MPVGQRFDFPRFQARFDLIKNGDFIGGTQAGYYRVDVGQGQDVIDAFKLSAARRVAKERLKLTDRDGGFHVAGFHRLAVEPTESAMSALAPPTAARCFEC